MQNLTKLTKYIFSKFRLHQTGKRLRKRVSPDLSYKKIICLLKTHQNTKEEQKRKPSPTNDTKQNTSSLHPSSSQLSNKAKKLKTKKAASTSSSNMPITTKKPKVSTTTISKKLSPHTFRYTASNYFNGCPLINIVNILDFMRYKKSAQKLLPFLPQNQCTAYVNKFLSILIVTIVYLTVWVSLKNCAITKAFK